MGNAAHAPGCRRDIYSRSAIRDPYTHHARLRQLGAVVWLPRQRVYALPCYAECKECCATIPARLRKLVAPRLTPKALRCMTEAVDRQADPTGQLWDALNAIGARYLVVRPDRYIYQATDDAASIAPPMFYSAVVAAVPTTRTPSGESQL